MSKKQEFPWIFLVEFDSYGLYETYLQTKVHNNLTSSSITQYCKGIGCSIPDHKIKIQRRVCIGKICNDVENKVLCTVQYRCKICLKNDSNDRKCVIEYLNAC